MTDEELLEYRQIVSAKEIDDDGLFEVTYSKCGHQATFVTPVEIGMEFKCSECIDILIERHKKMEDKLKQAQLKIVRKKQEQVEQKLERNRIEQELWQAIKDGKPAKEIQKILGGRRIF